MFKPNIFKRNPWYVDRYFDCDLLCKAKQLVYNHFLNNVKIIIFNSLKHLKRDKIVPSYLNQIPRKKVNWDEKKIKAN